MQLSSPTRGLIRSDQVDQVGMFALAPMISNVNVRLVAVERKREHDL